jgi:hypothetical protein
MDKPRKKIRVVGDRRAHLDVKRFADALVAFALHRLQEDGPAVEPVTASADARREAS